MPWHDTHLPVGHHRGWDEQARSSIDEQSQKGSEGNVRNAKHQLVIDKTVIWDCKRQKSMDLLHWRQENLWLYATHIDSDIFCNCTITTGHLHQEVSGTVEDYYRGRFKARERRCSVPTKSEILISGLLIMWLNDLKMQIEKKFAKGQIWWNYLEMKIRSEDLSLTNCWQWLLHKNHWKFSDKDSIVKEAQFGYQSLRFDHRVFLAVV